MDINMLRAITTLVLFVLFVGLCIRIYSPSKKKYYEEMAQIPLADEEVNV